MTEREHWLCKLWGHKYRARYDTKVVPEAVEQIKEMVRASVEGGYSFETPGGVDQTYVQDVCKRCGDTIKRREEG